MSFIYPLLPSPSALFLSQWGWSKRNILCLLWNEYPAEKGFPCCKWSGKQGVPQQETNFILPFSFWAPQHGYSLRSCCFLQRSKMVEAGWIQILDKSCTVKNHLTSWILPPWAHKLATCQEGQIARDSKKKANHYVKHVRRFNDQNITLLKKEYWSDEKPAVSEESFVQ